MIVALKSFTMRGVRYGPPGRPDHYRAQLAEAEARLAAVDQEWAEREVILIGKYGDTDGTSEAEAFRQRRDELQSVITRLRAQIADEELPVKQIVPKVEWDKLAAYKQRNFLSARYVAQREGRKLQEA